MDLFDQPPVVRASAAEGHELGRAHLAEPQRYLRHVLDQDVS